MTTLAEARAHGIQKLITLNRRRAEFLGAARERNRKRLVEQQASISRLSLKHRRQRTTAFDLQVLQELAQGPRAAVCMAQALDSSENKVKSSLRRLACAGKAVVIGTAFDLGRADLHQRALIWALSGTPMLERRAVTGKDKKRTLAPPIPKSRRRAVDPERVAGWRTIGRGLVGWGGWGNWL